MFLIALADISKVCYNYVLNQVQYYNFDIISLRYIWYGRGKVQWTWSRELKGPIERPNFNGLHLPCFFPSTFPPPLQSLKYY